ncbi:unnamed protein product [Ambrosiozyma monospora]|uniref:NADPH--hemoprotein reductase n=1 Tax=Ambrosiozyma monospora TaxID=43982 RepID=A0A9W6Z027_AMBMO|nr:unnamed protein product [Ambrosiozyma monospora]
MSTQLWFPTPVSLKALVQYYLEINGTVSRQIVGELVQFAPSERTKLELSKLVNDKALFKETVTDKLLSLHRLLHMISEKDEPWTNVPFSFLLESLGKLQPRFYSISSSNLRDPLRADIVFTIDSNINLNFKGVCSNNLLDLRSSNDGENSYDLQGPNGRYQGCKLPVFIRRSRFKLPLNLEKPIIMIGPGTGVAPFRGFIEHRILQFKKLQNKEKMGKLYLFCGSRNEDDLIYVEEWNRCKEILGDKFEIAVAFSRDVKNGGHKVYVQDLLLEKEKLIGQLIVEEGCHVYVCGDAKGMSKGVSKTLIDILSTHEGGDLKKGDKLFKGLRTGGKYHEDVW